MSPPGEPGVEAREVKERVISGSGVNGQSSSLLGPSGERADALPIRLSVAQGGLGLELSSPMDLNALVVEEFDVALLGVKYPVDLSKGVKQFRSRRSQLRRAVLRIDLSQLAQLWAEALTEFWGERVEVRLRPVSESNEQMPLSATPPPSGGAEGQANDGGEACALAVTIYSATSALAFDLLLSSGDSPRFLVDTPRAIGRKEPPLSLALHSIDAGLAQVLPSRTILHRVGRAIEVTRLSEAVSLAVLPRLGCRLPLVLDQVVQKVELTKGALYLTLGLRQMPFTAGGRALRVAGLADFVAKADDLSASGDLAGSREAYLGALEETHGHADILQDLAELDLACDERAESALSFLLELEAATHPSTSPEALSRFQLALGSALLGTGREELAHESWREAFEFESDSIFAALLGAKLAASTTSASLQRQYLDLAVSRAPFLVQVRLQRFQVALLAGDLETASLDAERLEAARSDPRERASLCLEVGKVFLDAGHYKRAQAWLGRALRLCPDDPEQLVALAAALEATGQTLRAAELYQSALRRLGEKSSADALAHEVNGTRTLQVERNHYLRTEASFRLALLLFETKIDTAQALGLLASVETRSHVGGEARITEAEIHEKASRPLARDSSISRLVEAVELGWINADACKIRSKSLLTALRNNGDPALVEFASRVLGDD